MPAVGGVVGTVVVPVTGGTGVVVPVVGGTGVVDVACFFGGIPEITFVAFIHVPYAEPRTVNESPTFMLERVLVLVLLNGTVDDGVTRLNLSILLFDALTL
jgi:hypothetical protein